MGGDHDMRSILFALALCGVAQSAAAQLTTMYAGTETQAGKSVPASAQFSVEDGHVAMIMKGLRSAHMIFDAKGQVLHIISDDDQTYFDIDKTTGGQGDPMQMMQQQLANMPASQRAMAEQMMKSVMGTMRPPLTYVWSTEKKRIAGYECTRVDGMRGDDKVTEYCGSTSADFKMSDAEHKTMLAMQSYLRNFTIMVQTADDGTRAFQWDTATDGYPVLQPLLFERHDDPRPRAAVRDASTDSRGAVRPSQGLPEDRRDGDGRLGARTPLRSGSSISVPRPYSLTRALVQLLQQASDLKAAIGCPQ